SINTENIFPIIKKWLYSDKDIFIRELISNSTDAISKHKQLVAIGETSDDEQPYKITVTVNKKEKTLSFEDNGIGMTDEEVKKYINQIAFSGAKDFVEKYKDKSDSKDQIIGHFGLGFYSAFMVAEKVTIDTKSFVKDAEAVRWESDGETEFIMDSSERIQRGTTITLHITKEEKEFLDVARIKETAKKYCGFMPFDIYIADANEKPDKEGEEKTPEPINDSKPLWLKRPSECSNEEYIEFYKKTFNDFQDPLFWIHLNMDYPFKLKGILYFPKLKHEFETGEGKIMLFYNQVYVADNIKEVIPEFLLLLKGMVDCPDLPLNVSRSFLQNDGYVQKISNHITKKVGDKLNQLFTKERENYNKYWDDINPFVKYGCLKEKKLYEKIKGSIIYKTINDTYVTLEEYLAECEETHKNKVYYVSDMNKQAQYIEMYKEHHLNAVLMPVMLDSHFINFIETENRDVKFESIDADIKNALKSEEQAEEMKELIDYFKKALENDKLKVETQALKNKDISAIIAIDEQSKRFEEMSKMYGGMNFGNPFQGEDTLILNTASPAVVKLAAMEESEDKAEVAKHIYQMAKLSAGKLDPKELSEFIKRSSGFLEKTI
ncbi:MAG: molecular chaperone HtpG, partial [Clostridia bacterium]|nr:molecular chaperone HtpG [Clostridia bacterium]